jgi:hypothetical protein
VPACGSGGPGLSEARCPVDAQLRVNATRVCHAADQGCGWRRVQALDHDKPGRGWVTPHGPRNMAHNILCSPGRPHGRRQDLPGRDRNIGDPCRRARPHLCTFDACHQTWLQRTGGLRAFSGLHAGLLSGAHEMHTGVVSVGCLVLPRADGLDVWVTGLGVVGAVVSAPIA